MSELDSATGRILSEQGIVAGDIFSLAYINRDTSLLAGDSDGKLTLIDAGALRRSRRPYDLPADCCLAVSQDGRTTLLLPADGERRVRTLADRAVERACQMAGRNLTTEEWSKFLPIQPFRKVCPQFP